MARVGHRVLSATTKAKIAASLRGNKNAYSGGPRKRLTSREKVANINARTKANKLNLSDAQIRQRTAVAKRLRGRARAEEAGINPPHSKSIPTPNTITQRDSKMRADASRVKGSIAKTETHSAGTNSRRKLTTEEKAQNIGKAMNKANKAGDKQKANRLFAIRQNLLEGKSTKGPFNYKSSSSRGSLTASEKLAKTNTGKGNFSNKETSKSDSGLDRRSAQKYRDLVNQIEADISSPKAANRSKPTTDPLTKRISKPAPMVNSKIAADRRAGEVIQAKQIASADQHKKNAVTSKRRAQALDNARPLKHR